MVEAVKQNYPQREIADASWELQEEIDRGDRIVVGVNAYQHEDETPLPLLRIDPALERKQIGRTQAVRARRDATPVEATLGALKEAAGSNRRQPHAVSPRRRPRPRDGGRDRRNLAGGLRFVPRDPRLLRSPPT